MVGGLARRASPAPIQRDGDAVSRRAIAIVHTRRTRKAAIASARPRAGRLEATPFAAIRVGRARVVVPDTGHHVAEIPGAGHFALHTREATAFLMTSSIAGRKRIAVAGHGSTNLVAAAAFVGHGERAAAFRHWSRRDLWTPTASRRAAATATARRVRVRGTRTALGSVASCSTTPIGRRRAVAASGTREDNSRQHDENPV